MTIIEKQAQSSESAMRIARDSAERAVAFLKMVAE